MRAKMLALCALLLSATPATARELIVSANDGKPVRPGDTAASQVADTLSVIEVTRSGVRTIATIAVPASMTGPPDSVKLTRDGRFAILTSAQRVNEAAPPLLVPGDTISVVDLRVPSRPRVVQTARAGAGAAGVAIDRAGNMVLVANGAADSVSIFRLVRGRLLPAGMVALPAGSKPVSIRIARDGRSALVSGASAGRVFRLAIAGGHVTATGESLATGRGPSAMTLSPDGRIAFVANGGGGTTADGEPAIGTVAMIDVADFRLLGTVPLGVLPEHIALSPSGRYLEVTLLDGSQLQPGAPGYHDGGRLRIFAVAGARVTPLAEIATGGLCQGAAWSHDETRVLLQCAGPRTIELYRFDGHTLTRDPAPPIAIAGRPGAMAGVATR